MELDPDDDLEVEEVIALQRLVAGLISWPALQTVKVEVVNVAAELQYPVLGLRISPSAQGFSATKTFAAFGVG